MPSNTNPVHIKNGNNYSGYNFIMPSDTKDCVTTYTSSDNDATTEKTSDGFTSVATMASGESHASLFQKISKMFLNIRKLWNTVGSTAIDTAYGATLTAQMANLKSYNTYSTSETWTGKYWIDGKKIYQKSYIGTVGNISGDTRYTVGTITDIDTFVKYELTWKTSLNYQGQQGYINNTTNHQYAFIEGGTNNFIVTFSSDKANSNYILTGFYTKTI